MCARARGSVHALGRAARAVQRMRVRVAGRGGAGLRLREGTHRGIAAEGMDGLLDPAHDLALVLHATPTDAVRRRIPSRTQRARAAGGRAGGRADACMP